MNKIIQGIDEFGYSQALLGMALSYYDGQEGMIDSWFSVDKLLRADKRAKSLSFMQGGHNKFLESIQVWLTIKATRAFWQEFDTYRVGVTKQSASTMHTLKKRELDRDDFSEWVDQRVIDVLNEKIRNGARVEELKDNLPEGFLQVRVVCTNYKVLQHIVSQRLNHRYYMWKLFCQELLESIERPDLILNKEAVEDE